MIFIIIKKDMLIVHWVRRSATNVAFLPPSPPTPTHHTATSKDVVTEAGVVHRVNDGTGMHGRRDACYWMQLYTCIHKVDCVHP